MPSCHGIAIPAKQAIDCGFIVRELARYFVEILGGSARHDLVVIEDCAQSIGARIGELPAGSFGHAATFSFCQDKIISTGGEGGMVLTRDHDVFNRIWSWKDHGKSRAKALAAPSATGFRWLHDSFGKNGRLTKMQGHSKNPPGDDGNGVGSVLAEVFAGFSHGDLTVAVRISKTRDGCVAPGSSRFRHVDQGARVGGWWRISAMEL